MGGAQKATECTSKISHKNFAIWRGAQSTERFAETRWSSATELPPASMNDGLASLEACLAAFHKGDQSLQKPTALLAGSISTTHIIGLETQQPWAVGWHGQSGRGVTLHSCPTSNFHLA